jgi:hypothetical protein
MTAQNSKGQAACREALIKAWKANPNAEGVIALFVVENRVDLFALGGSKAVNLGNALSDMVRGDVFAQTGWFNLEALLKYAKEPNDQCADEALDVAETAGNA